MKPNLSLIIVTAAVLLSAACTFPSSRRTVPASQAGVMQNIETGTVQSVRQVNIEGQRTNLGMYGGGLVGGAAASGIGRGVGSAIASATGAVGGAIVGQATEEAVTRKNAQEIVVRLDDGRSVVVTQAIDGGLFREGDRVRILNGGGGARVAMDVGP
jgi:outer membrane lipoprotein SlyB